MYLVEILLPITDRARVGTDLAELSRGLTDKFGGVTTFVRAPGEGLWESGEAIVRDDLVVMEVMTPVLDRAWWAEFRKELERRMDQEEIVIRAHTIERL